MEFREFAAHEVSALVDRLASHADGPGQDRLNHLQQEHDGAVVGLRRQLAGLRLELDAAKADVLARTREFESTLEEMRAEYANTLREQALARMTLPLDELLAVYHALSNATTPYSVLKTIVTGLSREFARVALFRVRGNGLECVTHAGFEFEGPITKVVIPTGIDSLLARALGSRTTQSFLGRNGEEAPPGAPFGGSPSCALALPIVLGDTAVAVIYADDSDHLEFASVPGPLLVKFAELVWQHATLVLQRATGAGKPLAVAQPHPFDRPA